MNIKVLQNDLLTSRVKELVQLLLPITNNKKLHIIVKSKGSSIAFIASNVNTNALDLRDYRFSTICSFLNASYYEIWNQITTTEYYLERAYCHLYLNDEAYLKNREDGEYILLHCDPNEDNGSPNAKYKQSPHIHVECAQYPISKVHFALYNGSLNEILKTKEAITVALQEAIIMLKEEVITKLLEES
jgi:hypothetical protein